MNRDQFVRKNILTVRVFVLLLVVVAVMTLFLVSAHEESQFTFHNKRTSGPVPWNGENSFIKTTPDDSSPFRFQQGLSSTNIRGMGSLDFSPILVSTFNSDTVDSPPATGGVNQPASLVIPSGGYILVRSSANGIMTKPAEINDGGTTSYCSMNYSFQAISQGVVRIEATASVDHLVSGWFLQTIGTPSSSVITRLVMTSSGYIRDYDNVDIGTYHANTPFRIRIIVDMDAKNWSAAIDNEMDGFDDDPLVTGLDFVNPPSTITAINALGASLNTYGGSGVTNLAYDDIIVGVVKDDILGSWASSGVWYLNSENGSWVYMTTPADPIAAGDIDSDGKADLIGVWSSGLWVKFSGSGTWAKFSGPPLPAAITVGDIDNDCYDDIVGSWPSGTFYRDTFDGSWVYLATPAYSLATGDLDGDYADDLIGVWSNGLWVKYSSSGTWWRICQPLPTDIAVGDMNGDGRDDVVGTWTSGTYYWDTLGGSWVYVSSSAGLVATGDLDGDETDDLIGTWGGAYAGLWVKYSFSMGWKKISVSLPLDIDAEMLRGGAWDVDATGNMDIQEPAGIGVSSIDGPGSFSEYKDLSDQGPGGEHFVCRNDGNPVPHEAEAARVNRAPGPGEPGFSYTKQRNLVPGESDQKKRIKRY